jgi:hypothetical protein
MPTEQNKWKEENISIKNLSLWDENARFPEEYFNKSEKELISYFLTKKKEFKIIDFAKEVVAEFDLPQLEKMVVLNLNGKSIVLEGNRRLTVYKLLVNPSLAKDSQTRKLFSELQKQVNINENFGLEVNSTSAKEEGLRFVDRKHNKNNNEIGWGEPERRNFAIRRSSNSNKDVLRVELANSVKKLALPDELKEAVLGKGHITTFYRIVDNEAAQKKLGYDVLDNGQIKIKDQSKFDDLLKIIAYNVWTKKSFDGRDVDSRSLNKREAIDDYLKSIRSKNKDKVDKEIKSQTVEDLFGGKTVIKKTGGKSKPISVLRKCLINSSLYINSNRINDIYNELRNKLIVDEVPNATAVLFRVFLECSIDCYIDKNKMAMPADIKLAGKIQKVADDLKKKKLATDAELKNIRKVATKDNNSILSVTTFHDFVHDYKVSPISSELKKHWENLDGFFNILWKSLSPSSGKKKIIWQFFIHR